MLIQISVDGPTSLRLVKTSMETGRTVEDLARSAVEETALRDFRDRKDDPGSSVDR